MLTAKTKKLLAQSLSLMGDYSFKTFQVAQTASVMNPRDSSIAKLCYSIFVKYATKEQPIFPFEMSISALFSMPMVRNFTDEVIYHHIFIPFINNVCI